MVAINLTELFKAYGTFEVFARFRREIYNQHRLELAGAMTVAVLDYDVNKDVITLFVFYINSNGDILPSPGIFINLEKTALEEVFKKIKQDLSLPQDFDLYKTLENALLEVSPDRALLYLNAGW